MKKFLFLLLAVLMLFSFVACGSETNVPEKEEASAPLAPEEPEPTPTPDPWIRVETEEEAEESAGFGIRLPIMEEASITYNVKTLGNPIILEAVFANGEDMAFIVRKAPGTENVSEDTNTYAYTEETNLYPGYFPVTLSGESDQDIRLVTWTQTVENAEYSYSVSFAESTANYAGALKVVMAVAEELPDVDDYTVARSLVACGRDHTVAVKKDGTVVATCDNEFGQCNVQDWTDIVAVAAGQRFTIGLRADGTVLGTGRNEYGQCNVSEWTDVKQIACGATYTLALKNDGTLHFTSPCHYERFYEEGLTTIDDGVEISFRGVLREGGVFSGISIANPMPAVTAESVGFSGRAYKHSFHAFGHQQGAFVFGVTRSFKLLDNGSCYYMPWTEYVEASEFDNVIYIDSGFSFVIGLMPGGRVVTAALHPTTWQLDTSDALDCHGELSAREWTDVIAVAGNHSYNENNMTFCAGVHSDGTVSAAGSNDYGQCDVSGWTDIGYPYHLANKIVEPMSLSFATLAASGEAEAVGNGLDRSAT